MNDRITPEKAGAIHRRVRVSELILRGLDQAEIVAALKAEGIEVTQQTISKDVRALADNWKQRMAFNTDAHKMILLERLERIARKAEDAFDVSLRPKKTIRGTERLARGDGGAEVLLAQTRHVIEEDRAGDASHLEAAVRASSEIAKIKGLYAPKVHRFDMDAATRRLAEMLSVDPDEIAPKNK